MSNDRLSHRKYINSQISVLKVRGVLFVVNIMLFDEKGGEVMFINDENSRKDFNEFLQNKFDRFYSEYIAEDSEYIQLSKQANQIQENLEKDLKPEQKKMLMLLVEKETERESRIQLLEREYTFQQGAKFALDLIK